MAEIQKLIQQATDATSQVFNKSNGSTSTQNGGIKKFMLKKGAIKKAGEWDGKVGTPTTKPLDSHQ